MKIENDLDIEEKILREIQQVITTSKMNVTTGENSLIQLSFNDVSFLVERVVKNRIMTEQLTKRLNVHDEVQRTLVDLSKQFKTRGKNHKKQNSALVKQMLTVINNFGLTKQTVENVEVVPKEVEMGNPINYDYNKIPSFEEVKSYYHSQNN